MGFKLNTWQTFLLFIPFIVGFIFLEIPHKNLYDYQTKAALANFLFVVAVFIVVNYQTYLALGFNSKSGLPSNVFKWNTYIPFAFITFYLLYVIYLTFICKSYHNPRYVPGPVRTSYFKNIRYTVFFIFLLHAFITFYFINNQFISKKIKQISDPGKQEALINDYLLPMRRLTQISYRVFLIILFLSAAYDLIKFHNAAM